jgi:hypothetical protein
MGLVVLLLDLVWDGMGLVELLDWLEIGLGWNGLE